jgi:adenine-specific DNA-methyltransferase
MGPATLFKFHRETEAFIDCQDNLSFMRPMRSGSVQLVVTSPPYNIGKSYEKRRSLEAYVNQQAQVISECVRLLGSQGFIMLAGR